MFSFVFIRPFILEQREHLESADPRQGESTRDPDSEIGPIFPKFSGNFPVERYTYD